MDDERHLNLDKGFHDRKNLCQSLVDNVIHEYNPMNYFMESLNPSESS